MVRVTLTILDVEQRSEEWFQARAGIVTASVVGKLLTPTLRVADNDTARGIIAGLVAERITGRVEETYTNADMMRGVLAEPFARDIYSTHYTQAVEAGFMVREEADWRLGYSPDGLVGDEGLLEVKAPRAKGHISTILADEVPSFYMPQLQAGLLVTGRDWIDFCSYTSGLPLFVKRIYPDPKWFNAITAACIQFEQNTAALVDRYNTAATGLHPTERIDFDLEVV